MSETTAPPPPADQTGPAPPPGPVAGSRSGLMSWLIGVAVIYFAVIWLLGVQVVRQIDALATAQLDSGQWTLSQLDIEALTLQLAVSHAVGAAPDARSDRLADLRRRFDILYSRVDTLRGSSLAEGLREHPVFKEQLRVIEGFVAATVPLIDGDDAVLAGSLDQIAAGLEPTRKATRIVSLTGLEVLANRSEAKRAAVRRTLIFASALTTALLVLLTALVVALWRLEQMNRRRTEETETALTRMAAIVGAAHDAVIVADWQGRIVDFNTAAAGLFGHQRAEAIGMAASALIGPDVTPPRLDGARDSGQNREGAASSEVQRPATGLPAGQDRQRRDVMRRDGSGFPAEFSVTATGTGPDRLFVIFLRDLSADVAAARALTEARDRAVAGEKAKADLLVVMSHEMRTPLNGLIGTLDLFGTATLDRDQRAHLEVLNAAAHQLLQHVNNVLDITRLDHGIQPVHLEAVDLGAIAAGILANQHAAALAQGTALSLTLPPPDRRRVMADPGLLRQLLLNLIGNAVKFTRQGSIAVDICHLGPAGPTRFAITDTGIGIAPENLSRVFDDFVTLDASYARVAGGTGLGLGIVRRIVQSLGGTVTAQSHPGQGSLFSFDLPLMILSAAAAADPLPAPEPPPTAAPLPRAAGLRLLLVEDNAVNRLIARTMLQRDGHEVAEAHDGEEAVRLAAALRFDAVLMDISMPGLDGLQATRAIREGQGASADVPIIALTAHAMADEVQRFLQGGMREVLIKPLTRARLAAALQGLSGPPPDTPAAPLVRFGVLATLRDDIGSDHADRLIAQFLAEGEAVLSALARHPDPDAAPPDLAEIARALHKIAGAASLFGASRLHQALAGAETACKTGDQAVLHALPGLFRLWQDTANAYRMT